MGLLSTYGIVRHFVLSRHRPDLGQERLCLHFGSLKQTNRYQCDSSILASYVFLRFLSLGLGELFKASSSTLLPALAGMGQCTPGHVLVQHCTILTCESSP